MYIEKEIMKETEAAVVAELEKLKKEKQDLIDKLKAENEADKVRVSIYEKKTRLSMKLSILLLVLQILLVACIIKSDIKYKNEIEELKHEIIYLEEESNKKEEEINRLLIILIDKEEQLFRYRIKESEVKTYEMSTQTSNNTKKY